MDNRRIWMMLIITMMILAAMACEDTTSFNSGQPFVTPLTYNQEALQAAYAAAQATQAAGQSKMIELSHQATVVSLNMEQAVNAAAQATIDENQRQLMELSIQANEVSQNMTQAAATQQFINAQNQLAWIVTANAQSQNTTATYSADMLHITQTAQAQATQTAQVYATQTAYPLTATPWALIQANIIRTQAETERRAIWNEFVITPLKVILPTLVVLLLVLGGVIAYLRLMPVLERRLLIIPRDNDSPLLLIDGSTMDPAHDRFTSRELRQLNYPRLSNDDTPQVEIIGSSEPSITNWIIEAERKLRTDGRMQS